MNKNQTNILLGIIGYSQHYILSYDFGFKKRVREKSRECHNHKPHPFPDTKRHQDQPSLSPPSALHSPRPRPRPRPPLPGSPPSEVIAMLKALKNTRTKWHKVRHKTNRPVEQSNKEQDQHRDHRPRTVSRVNHTKTKPITTTNKNEHSWPIPLHARVNENQ